MRIEKANSKNAKKKMRNTKKEKKPLTILLRDNKFQ